MDISDVWEKKLAAVKAYQSQLKNNNCDSIYSLLERLEITAKYFGQCINARYAEPFIGSEPVSITSFLNLT
jgi:LmbE family N-acetylglucosaminyl deacetylase